MSSANTRAMTVVTALALSLLLAGCAASTPAASTKPAASTEPATSTKPVTSTKPAASAAPVSGSAVSTAPAASAGPVSASAAPSLVTGTVGIPAPVDAPERDGTYAVQGAKFDAPVWFAKAKAEGKPFVGVINYGTYESDGASGESSTNNLCIIFLIAGSLKVISTKEVVQPITVDVAPGDAMFTTDGCKPWVKVG